MIRNLFSIFDPLTYLCFRINWLRSGYFFLFIPLSFFLKITRLEAVILYLFKWILGELGVVFQGKRRYNLIFFIVLFLMLIYNNFLGLFPYIFTSPSHIVYSLTFSLIIWLIIILYGWINNTEDIFVHILPLGTPAVLIIFIILIETVRNIIRPLTLAVRLSANMIAGHLLLTLIGEVGEKVSSIFLRFILSIQLILFILEISVSLIQAYVFTVLGSLYLREIN